MTVCGHSRIIRSGKQAGWQGTLGKRTLTCLDCGTFWLWHSDGNYFSASGIHGGKMSAKLQTRRARIDGARK